MSFLFRTSTPKMSPAEEAKAIIHEISNKNVDEMVRATGFTNEVEEVSLLHSALALINSRLMNSDTVGPRPYPPRINQLDVLQEAGF